MLKPNNLRQNFILNLALSALNLIYPILTLTYASRIIGPNGIGKFYFSTSLATYFLMIAGLGIPIYGAREISKRKNDQAALDNIFSELFILNGIATLILSSLFILMIIVVPSYKQNQSLLLILSSLVIINIFATDFLFVGLEKFKNIAWRSIASKTLLLPLLFVFIKEPEDLHKYAIWTSAVSMMYAVLGFLSIQKFVRLKFYKLNFKQHYKSLFTLTCIIATVNIYTNLDSVLLGSLTDAENVGLFNVGTKLSKIFILLISTTSLVLMPRLTQLSNNEMQDQFVALTSKSIHFICFLAIPLTLFIISAAPEIVEIGFGKEFMGATSAMKISAPLIVIIGFSNVLGMQVLFSKGYESYLLISVVIAAILSVILNLLLVPRLGSNGSAIALVAAESMVLLIQWVGIRLKMPWMKFKLNKIILPAMVSIILIIPLPLLRLTEFDPRINLPLSAIIGGTLYLLILFSLKEPITTEVILQVSRKFRRH